MEQEGMTPQEYWDVKALGLKLYQPHTFTAICCMARFSMDPGLWQALKSAGVDATPDNAREFYDAIKRIHHAEIEETVRSESHRILGRMRSEDSTG